MITTPWPRAAVLARGALVLAVLSAGSLVASSSATTTPKTGSPGIVLTSPQLTGVASLPGPVISSSLSPSLTMGLLKVTPSEGPAGTPLTISGTGLPATTAVRLTWSTNTATWVADPEPDTVNYLGRAQSSLTVLLHTVLTNGSGAFTYHVDAPRDFGGSHDIYALVGNTEVDHGGFIMLRTLSVSPRSGPIGTPITITYSGMGASLYTGGASVLWDNHYAGEMMANWTRGSASISIRAAGPVGEHLIQVGNAISYMYLNVAQSPIPFTNGGSIPFDVTADNGPPAASISAPANVAPTVSERTTLQNAGLDPSSKATMTLGSPRGVVNTAVVVSSSHLAVTGTVQLIWSTVVGNRVNCNSTCWSFVSQNIGSATVTGGALHTSITVPDGLGGWHVIQVVKNGLIEAQAPYYVQESIVGAGVSSLTVKQGQEFTIHIKGIGWTQLDNTVGVDYDNSYMGYGCGFNSNGDVVIHLRATGGPGTHLIDLYPMLYSLSPSFANTPYGMVPVLSYARDFPGLALGYHVGAMHFAIRVVN